VGEKEKILKNENLTPSALNEFSRAIFEHLNYSFLRRRQFRLKITTFFTHHRSLITPLLCLQDSNIDR